MYFLTTILLAGMVLSSVAQSPIPHEWNKKSILTTERQVELPGIILEPGSYIVRLHESAEGRSHVQILNRDENQVLATVLAVPDHHTRPEGDAEFSYHQVQGNGPRTIKSWFYTSDIIGLEFVYPKIRALELAKASQTHVMASNNKDDAIVAITPNGKEIVIDDPIQTARRKPQ